MVQWLRLCMSTTEAADSTPGPGTGIPQAVTQPENFLKTFFKKVMKQDPSPQESVFVHGRPVHLGMTGWTGSMKSYPFTFSSLYLIDLVLWIDIKERIPLVKTNASQFYLLVHFYFSFQSFRSSNLHCPFYDSSLVFWRKFLCHYLLALKFCLNL